MNRFLFTGVLYSAYALTLFSLYAAPVPAVAWSGRPHSLIADIAAQLLTSTASRTVGELLEADLYADGQPSGRTSLGQVASWPDELRATSEQRATGVYHYDDIPVCGIADREDYCADGKCASAWLAKQLVILADPSQSHRSRNEALKWVVHLIGDIHQPLHASDHDDKGGNDVQISFIGKRADDEIGGRQQPPYNLHTAWGRLIPTRVIDGQGGDESFVARLPDTDTRSNWEVGTIEQWVDKSHVLAKDFVYPSLPGFSCDDKIVGFVELDGAYVRAASVIASEQLQKAGVRLAKVLNEALDSRGMDGLRRYKLPTRRMP